AAHCDAYSRSCSNTSRTARSRTSGEYFFACLMTPISQELESPANPGRFMRESTIAPEGFADDGGGSRDMTPYQAAIAWNLTTAAFYKAGGRPWKIASIRDGVCYIGLVFK